MLLHSSDGDILSSLKGIDKTRKSHCIFLLMGVGQMALPVPHLLGLKSNDLLNKTNVREEEDVPIQIS